MVRDKSCILYTLSGPQTSHAQAAEIHELTKRLEDLTEDTPAWYAGMRSRVEARAALEQAEKLGRVLEELGERLGE
jgi:hypothetical protein